MSTPTKVILLALLLFTSVLFAQGTTPPPPAPPPGEAPIDGILWLGGLVALAYGAVKKYKNPKE